jgi:hypothetical protein
LGRLFRDLADLVFGRVRGCGEAGRLVAAPMVSPAPKAEHALSDTFYLRKTHFFC